MEALARAAPPPTLGDAWTRTPTLSVLDLFAGAGGLTRGFDDAGGFRSVQAVELDVAAAATFTRNHPDTSLFVGPIQEWVRDCGVPEVDIIVGGPPCQGFSTLNRADVQDERNDLWREYATVIVKARPKYFVVENVAAFKCSPQFSEFQQATRPGELLADYTFRADVLNAANYGAAQARRRTVLIGHHRDLPFPGWPEVTHRHASEFVTVGERLLGVRRAVAETELADVRVGPFSDTRDVAISKSVRVPDTLPGVFVSREAHIGRKYSTLSRGRFAAIPYGGNRFNIPDDLKAQCWRRHTTGTGDVMGRLVWEKPSVTIRTEFFKPEKGRYLHPTEDRAITHYEAALLQGFSEDYQWVGSKVAIARQIGNAVPIPLGSAIAAAIRDGSKRI